MRILPYVVAVVALAGCVAQQPTAKHVGTPSSAPLEVTQTAAPLTSRPIATASELPPLVAALIAPERKSALTSAMGHALAPTEAVGVQGVLGDTSQLISNNGGAVISDNGAGLVANNAGNLIANNGGGYVLLDLPSPLIRSGKLVFLVLPTSDTTGDVRIYDGTLYDAAGDDKDPALLDHISWSNKREVPGIDGDPTLLEIRADLQVVSSKRLPHVEKVTYAERYRYTGPGARKREAMTYTAQLHLDLPQLGSSDPQIVMTAGAADMGVASATNGSTLLVPKHLSLTGSDGDGKLTGEITFPDDLGFAADLSYTSAKGNARVVTQGSPDGHKQRQITADDAQMTVVLDLDAQQRGRGDVFDTSKAGQDRVAVVDWTASGAGTATFADQSTAPVAVF